MTSLRLSVSWSETLKFRLSKTLSECLRQHESSAVAKKPRDATAFQIHPEELYLNEPSLRLLRLHVAWNSVFSKRVSYSNSKYV